MCTYLLSYVVWVDHGVEGQFLQKYVGWCEYCTSLVERCGLSAQL
jgi:hypothetical protein